MSNKFNLVAEYRNIGNAFYHATVISGLAVGYAKMIKWIFGGTGPFLVFTGKDITMITMGMTAQILQNICL